LGGSLDWATATLEQKKNGRLESEKIAVGCSGSDFYVQRYSPDGNSHMSIVQFDGGPPLSIEWTRLNAPNTMWAYGLTARLIIDALLSARTVSFQEVDARARAPVTFDVDGARRIIGPIVDICHYDVPAS
jgi:hypothetical protein